MVSPHFPPDSSAGAHRVRLLAPHLPRYGWTPTVLTVDPAYYEGKLDPGLAALVPEDLRVERVRAIPARVSRLIGIGDLGIRAMPALYRAANKLLSTEHYDAIYVTIYPTYPALIGPMVKRRHHIPFILDYQDPWVSEWGKSVGAGYNGAVDLRSRLTRRAALSLEPIAVRSADAITAVSAQTVDGLADRIPAASEIPKFDIPIGGEAADFAQLRRAPGDNPYFDPRDGLFHLCYVGTILPLGVETLRAVLSAVAILRSDKPDLYRKLRLHFFGTSNERVAGSPARVLGHALELGIRDVVTEHPTRIDYTHALRVQLDASALLLLGSSEPHYTASKLYPALLARKPLLAAYHRESTVSTTLEDYAGPSVCLVRYSENDPPSNHLTEINRCLVQLMENSHVGEAPNIMHSSLRAENLAGILAVALDQGVMRFGRLSR